MTKLGALHYPTVDPKGNPIPFDSLFLPYIWKEIYLEGIYIDVFNQQQDMVILDIGANVGLVTNYMREFAKQIYAIEPSPEHFAALKQNKEYNQWDNVEVFEMAIADTDSEMTLNTFDKNRTCHSLVNDYHQGGATVKTQRLDTFFKANNIKEVDFIKMDVENYEDILLRSEGFLNVVDKIKSIMLEFHNPQWPELVEHMSKLGFKARRYQSSGVIVLFFK